MKRLEFLACTLLSKSTQVEPGAPAGYNKLFRSTVDGPIE